MNFDFVNLRSNHLSLSHSLSTGDGSYTHKRLQGQVADGDCYAMGGIAGHAGVFSTAGDIGHFLRYMLSMSLTANKGSSAAQEELDRKDFLNASTVQLFTALHNSSQSSRALGWSINTPLVRYCILDSLICDDCIFAGAGGGLWLR
jgi:CubicO group peptidase (beta-lactamase class C family)